MRKVSVDCKTAECEVVVVPTIVSFLEKIDCVIVILGFHQSSDQS